MAHFHPKNFCEILYPTFSAVFSRLNCSTSSYSEIIVPFLYNIVNQFRSQSTTVFFYTSLSFQVTQKELKPCINARFQPFYDLITFYTIFISKLCESALFTHLFCNFCCEVLVLLLHTFAGLETNESLNSDISTVLFRNLCYVLSYALLAILSFYINLV